ncbi:MAG: hypothetical protein M1817_006230 [Caeruleum heppii]|nr:MAG: hypothetical protein M1817_006230 [Caeruleum heppii]
MPRLIRRRPLSERIANALNPLDWLITLSEALDSNDWDDFQRSYAIPIGFTLNLVFLIARANGGSGSGISDDDDDVFRDTSSGHGWFSWFSTFLVHLLTFFSFLNALYTFYRKRHYRLFESPISAPPSTPSAHRVKVNSSPMSSSPLRFLANIIASTTETAESRAHPDASKDVWELGVWDPLPLCLRIFCLFSPGHVVVYWMLLPPSASDPWPSTTVLKAITLGGLLATQLWMLQTSFSQQGKDTAVIHKEVLHEYDTKYVHPTLNPPVRDVSTQHDISNAFNRDPGANGVEIYTPTTIINRGFHTHPNPNYAMHLSNDSASHTIQSNIAGPRLSTSAFTPGQISSPLRRTAVRQPQFRSTSSTSTSTGDGGSLGIYTHANSPLKKTPSTTSSLFSSPLPPQQHHHHHPKPSPVPPTPPLLQNQHLHQRVPHGDRPRTSLARPVSPTKSQVPGSPLKRSSVPGGLNEQFRGAQQSGRSRGSLLGPGTGGMPARRESGYF